jgi:ferric-dicitrate binding protein FerR (iron transport regulator)
MTMDYQNNRLSEEEHRLQQAGDWFVRLRQEDTPPEQLTAWLEWSRSDPRNLEAFERIRDLSLGLDALDR